MPVLFRDHYRPDVVLLHTSSRRHDTVSLGTEVNILPAAIESVRERGGLVIVQSNPQMPYTYGDAQVYEHEIDYLVEVDEPLPTHSAGALDDVSRQIGELIAARVQDNSTLQLGIGAVPDAVLASLTQQKGLRIWTEMFSDGVLELYRRDALDREVPITASFIFGSAELYEWIHLNKWIRMLRTERTNDPGQIARQAKMTSVNAALQVDLFDQANASRVKGRIYSGFGGSTDFIVGALHSRGGQSFIALPSWHKKAERLDDRPAHPGARHELRAQRGRDRERHRLGVRSQPERARHEHHRARRASGRPRGPAGGRGGDGHAVGAGAAGGRGPRPIPRRAHDGVADRERRPWRA